MPARQRFRLALLAFCLSFALRLAWAAWSQVTPVSDFRGYDLLAVHWLDTGVLGAPGHYAYRTPGYPAFLALIYTAFGHSWKAVALVQAFLGGLTSALTAVLATYVLSSRGSLLAGLLHALSPTALAYIPVLASENVAVFLLMAGLLLVAVARRASGRGANGAGLASGLLLGLVLLVRPAAVFFAPAWVFLLAYAPTRRRLLLLPAALTVAAAALVISPWLVRNHRLGLGPMTLSTAGGVNLAMGNNDLAVTGGYIREAQATVDTENLTEVEADKAYRKAAIDWIRAHPGRYFALCATRLIRLLGVEPDWWAARYLLPEIVNDRLLRGTGGEKPSPDSHPSGTSARVDRIRAYSKLLLAGIRAVIAPLILLSLVLSFSRWRQHLVVVLPVLSYIVGLTLTYAQIRFRELIDPLLFIPVAAFLADTLFGSHELGELLNRRQKAVVGATLIMITLGVHASGLASSIYRLSPPH
ncbi:MAG TPA: glycosyltransferase family 39 protein [Anaerolineae bacterium]|nr:glycosyltransferase family 39 protein [Anaerolineae bacterium]